MKAYLAIKYYPDQANRALIEAITHALAQNGYETVCIARDVEQWGRNLSEKHHAQQTKTQTTTQRS